MGRNDRFEGLDRCHSLVTAPSGGRVSVSPLFGQNDVARSACAVIVSDGFTCSAVERGGHPIVEVTLILCEWFGAAVLR
jgi:hypothetical protein